MKHNNKSKKHSSEKQKFCAFDVAPSFTASKGERGAGKNIAHGKRQFKKLNFSNERLF
jgi:hypothetical protein